MFLWGAVCLGLDVVCVQVPKSNLFAFNLGWQWVVSAKPIFWENFVFDLGITVVASKAKHLEFLSNGV